MSGIAFTIGQGFAARAIKLNASQGMKNYVLRGDELFATFQMGGETVEIKQDVPNMVDIVGILTHKHHFRPEAITPRMVSEFRHGYTSAYVTHILKNQKND